MLKLDDGSYPKVGNTFTYTKKRFGDEQLKNERTGQVYRANSGWKMANKLNIEKKISFYYSDFFLMPDEDLLFPEYEEKPFFHFYGQTPSGTYIVVDCKHEENNVRRCNIKPVYHSAHERTNL